MKTLMVLLVLTATAAFAQSDRSANPLKPAQIAFDKLSPDNIGLRVDVTTAAAEGAKDLRISIRGNKLGSLTVECAMIYKNAFGGTTVNIDASKIFEKAEGEITLSTRSHPGVKGWLVRVLHDGKVVGVAASSSTYEDIAKTLDPAQLIKGK